MNKQNPRKNIDCLEKVLEAWRSLAPTVSFGGLQLSDFEAKVVASQTSRLEVTDRENDFKAAIVNRDNADAAALALKSLIVNGVVGDPNYGPDSALYEAMGYVRKSERASGLTRKKKQPVT